MGMSMPPPPDPPGGQDPPAVPPPPPPYTPDPIPPYTPEPIPAWTPTGPPVLGSSTPPPPPPPGSASYPAATPPPPPPPPSTTGYAPILPPGYQPYVSSPMGELAGFWIRFASLLLDSILYGLLAAVFVIPAVTIGVLSVQDCTWVETDIDNSFELKCPPGTPDGAPIALAVLLGVVGLLLVMFIYCRALGRGQTWGMRLTSIKLVRADNGMPAGFGKALGRSLFASLVSAQIFYLGYLWAAWDDKKQTWQDKICSTYVVRT